MQIARPTFSPEPAPRDAVLITRPEPGASETAARIAELGFCPIVAPMLTVRPLTARLPPTTGLQAVLITSANALYGLPRAHRVLPLLAVGAATAQRARRIGFPEVVQAGGDATALAQLAAQRCRPRDGALLLATARGEGDALVADLRAQGFRVVRRTVYATDPVRKMPHTGARALSEDRLRAVLFFSAATARAFIGLMAAPAEQSHLPAIEAIAIAETTAEALSCLPWKRVRVAVRPTQDDILALLQ